MLFSVLASADRVQPPAPAHAVTVAWPIGRRLACAAIDPAAERGYGLHGDTFDAF